MAESLWLRLGSGRSNEGGLSLSRRGGRRKEGDLFADGAAKILEGLLDIRGVVVGLVGVLRAIKPCQNTNSRACSAGRYRVDLRHSKHLLVGLLEGIDTLLEIDIVGRELGL